jgi:hypothetical protein
MLREACVHFWRLPVDDDDDVAEVIFMPCLEDDVEFKLVAVAVPRNRCAGLAVATKRENGCILSYPRSIPRGVDVDVNVRADS